MRKLLPIIVVLCAGSAARAQESEVTSEDKPAELAASEPARVQRSADAVVALNLQPLRLQPRDLGDVLAHSQGLSLRRRGGLGSETEVLLVGLTPALLIDGVPLELLGARLDTVGVPLQFLERVDVYRGVLPVRIASATLGGALNLIRDARYDSHAEAAFHVGSFHTYRVAASGRYRDRASGLFAGGSAFADLTDNDYAIQVEVPTVTGALSTVEVPRFHDAYRAHGLQLEAGVVDRSWAKRLALEAFASRFDKELQHDASMRVPYGEARYGQTSFGATAHYEADLASDVGLEVVASYAHRVSSLQDRAEWVYDWYGMRMQQRIVPGETGSREIDSALTRDGVFGRALVSWRLAPEHALRVSVTPWFSSQRANGVSGAASYLSLVSGLEYQLDLFNGALTNLAFVKDYVYAASGQARERPEELRELAANAHRVGAGLALRARLTPWLDLAGSYEYAVQFPGLDQVVGDGQLVLANVELEPEFGHNGNFGPHIELRDTSLGAAMLDLNAFVRDTHNQIVLLAGGPFASHENLLHSRTLGLESRLAWSAPARWLSVETTWTWLDARNVSNDLPFSEYADDRIPNRPFLYGSWGVHGCVPDLPGHDDTLEPYYRGRYVHGYAVGFQSQGLSESKPRVPAQLTHDLGVSWTLRATAGRITLALELTNFADARIYDFFGVQRPGRAIYAKMSGEI